MEQERLVRELLSLIGEEPTREGLLETPKRVVKSWRELYAGYAQDPNKILSTQFDKGLYEEIIVLRDIEFFSTCEHHLLPFVGKAHVGYVPDKKVVGLSKLARVVDCFSRRLQIQERMTTEIADAIEEALDPIGVAVVVEAQHFCMISRGVNKKQASMRTTCFLGCFDGQDAWNAREEFWRTIGDSK